MALLGPDQKPLARGVPAWEGSLPRTGDYFLQVKPASGISQSSYQLTVSLTDPTPPSPTPTPTPTPTEPDSPPPVEVEVERVRFADGATGQRVAGRATPEKIKRYLVNAAEGQVLATQVVNGTVTLNIRNPDGELVENASKVLSWESQLPTGGDYRIDVVAQDQTDFMLNVTVRDLE